MLDFHPDYGLTDDVRLTILRTAAAVGVKRAALEHSVSIQAIYNWRKKMETGQ